MLSRWSWFSSPATKKRAHEHKFSSRAVVLVLLVCGVAFVFWQQLIGAAVFIGETDRLNTYLNMRLAEYDALRTYGAALGLIIAAAAVSWLIHGPLIDQLVPKTAFQIRPYGAS